MSDGLVMDVKEKKVNKEVIAFNPPIDWIRKKIENAGTTIGSVHFHKRENGELRKMCYRLHVTKPSVASIPKGLKQEKQVKDELICIKCGKSSLVCDIGPFATRTIVDSNIVDSGLCGICGKNSKDCWCTTNDTKKDKKDKKAIDVENNQITVLDANKVVRDNSGNVIGRGAWRCIPLENVIRIVNRGVTYNITRYDSKS